MLPPALEMSGFRRLRRNFAPIITATLRIMEVVIIERKAFEALMADVSSLTEKVNRLCGRESVLEKSVPEQRADRPADR